MFYPPVLDPHLTSDNMDEQSVDQQSMVWTPRDASVSSVAMTDLQGKSCLFSVTSNVQFFLTHIFQISTQHFSWKPLGFVVRKVSVAFFVPMKGGLTFWARNHLKTYAAELKVHFIQV